MTTHYAAELKKEPSLDHWHASLIGISLTMIDYKNDWVTVIKGVVFYLSWESFFNRLVPESANETIQL